MRGAAIKRLAVLSLTLIIYINPSSIFIMLVKSIKYTVTFDDFDIDLKLLATKI